jgi:hypothetical protein
MDRRTTDWWTNQKQESATGLHQHCSVRLSIRWTDRPTQVDKPETGMCDRTASAWFQASVYQRVDRPASSAAPGTAHLHGHPDVRLAEVDSLLAPPGQEVLVQLLLPFRLRVGRVFVRLSVSAAATAHRAVKAARCEVLRATG